jgi:XTP/dITP diphosphohydrolase/tetrapyrrole methylase family protein/MazG family protein
VNAIHQLKETVERLRAPGGCPWDREQTHQTLADCLIEETAELLDTIDRLDMEHMREELGDVLLQVVFHAVLAEEKGLFNLDNIAQDIDNKLIRRHPHVFGNVALNTSNEVIQQWEQIKAAERKEKQGRPAGDDLAVPDRLSALLFARDMLKKLSKRKTDLSAVLNRLPAPSTPEEQMGHELLALVIKCRAHNIDPESALRRLSKAILTEVAAGE